MWPGFCVRPCRLLLGLSSRPRSSASSAVSSPAVREARSSNTASLQRIPMCACMLVRALSCVRALCCGASVQEECVRVLLHLRLPACVDDTNPWTHWCTEAEPYLGPAGQHQMPGPCRTTSNVWALQDNIKCLGPAGQHQMSGPCRTTSNAWALQDNIKCLGPAGQHQGECMGRGGLGPRPPPVIMHNLHKRDALRKKHGFVHTCRRYVRCPTKVHAWYLCSTGHPQRALSIRIRHLSPLASILLRSKGRAKCLCSVLYAHAMDCGLEHPPLAGIAQIE